MQNSEPARTYRIREEAFAAEHARLVRNLRLISHARTVTFLVGLLCLLGVWDVSGLSRLILLVCCLAAFSCFAWLVAFNSRTKIRARFQEELRKLNVSAQKRLCREWNELPELDYGPPPDHAYAADLDLFGHASLFQLLGTTTTVPGRETLRDWLLIPASREDIVQRQQAVAELVPLVDYRNDIEAHGRLIGREHPHAVHLFLDWTKANDWIRQKPALVWAARLLPVVTVASLIAHISGLFPVPIWVLSIAVCVIVSLRTHGRMHSVFNLVASGDNGLRRYAPIFVAATATRFNSPMLASLLADMRPAAPQMKRLDRLIACAEVRYSGMLYGILQMLFMWDHNVLYRLEEWRRISGVHVDEWVSALGKLEALAALAALSHAHPDWAMPEVSDPDAEPVLKATSLGHPLLKPEVCEVNDVVLGPPGTFLFVTGSNMSGKSTLLRSIGVNAVLAQAGGPVYATQMFLPRVSVFTSMRIADSLEQGISQYMAQLSRLRKIVDGASAASSAESGELVVFLLDEILQGTNSAERLVAVRKIIRRLLDYGAIGAVTSHELTVPDVPELEDAATVVHFRETAERTEQGVTLSFDYKLRPGLSTSTNALKLMEMVGLD